MRPETIKLLEENIGRTVNDMNQSKILYDPSRVTEIKTKVNTWALIKLKGFCTAKETVNKFKTQSLQCEITLYAKQKKRHRCTEQTLGLCGVRRGWDVLR